MLFDDEKNSILWEGPTRRPLYEQLYIIVHTKCRLWSNSWILQKVQLYFDRFLFDFKFIDKYWPLGWPRFLFLVHPGKCFRSPVHQLKYYLDLRKFLKILEYLINFNLSPKMSLKWRFNNFYAYVTKLNSQNELLDF